MRVEIFYVNGCPNRESTVKLVAEALQGLGIAGEVVELPVNDSASASALRFLGSPTVHINGVDVEPSARASDQFGLMCRTYPDGPRRAGVPAKHLIRQAFLELLESADAERKSR